MSKRRTGAGTIAALALACVFGATMLLSLAAGAGVYRRVAERVERGAAERVGLTYVTAKVRDHNAWDMVQVRPFGDESAVWLGQRIEGDLYDTILYVHDGYLMELFCEHGAELEPSDGLQIAEARALEVSREGNLLRLAYTDAYGVTETALLRVFGAEEGE